MNYQTIETALERGIALIRLNRPELRNAMNDVLIGELADAVERAVDDGEVRVIVLAGRGKAFCAGGDLNWMKRARELTPEQAREDSAALARLLRALYESPKPVVARVHGAAFAGGMGLVAACDIAVASTDTRFCLSEVKLGLIPAMISPYVVRAIGEANARRYFLTAEVFDAAEAFRIGLVHDLAAPDELDAKVDALLGHLLLGGPQALGQAKRLIRDVAARPIDDALTDDTAARIAALRASDEGQEGIAAFFEKRRPSWVRE
ncbi:MAG: enoyl-CoA hydratase/isomerase family protein [Burkholderiales bacterium]|nr:enoyl-CoA hydratase/isomerase family protein [Burkholderiales bacterium]OJX06411.1 MAG: enoyl-CoA hydratase [Burkholderiales bacterium 70-64]